LFPWLWRYAQSAERLGQRLGLEHHTFTAAERTIVDGAVSVVSKVAQVMGFNGHQSLGLGAAHNAVLKDAGKEAGEDGDDVELHTG